MAYAGKLYGQVAGGAFTGNINWSGAGRIKAMLVGSAYIPNQDTHVNKSDVTSEIVGTGYTAGGQAIANPVIAYTAATNATKFDCDDIVWTSATVSGVRYIVFYDSTSNKLIGYVDLTADKSSENADFKLIIDTAGVFVHTVA